LQNMARIFGVSPQLTQAVVGIPYNLGGYIEETPRFVPRPGEVELRESSIDVHAAVGSLLVVHCQTLLREESKDLPPKADYVHALRTALLDEVPVRLRREAQALIRWHNGQRLQPGGGPLDDVVADMFRFVPFGEIAEASPEDAAVTANYLKITGYLGRGQRAKSLPVAAGERLVPHDALAFFALYPPVPTAHPDDLTAEKVARKLHVANEEVRRLAGEIGMGPVVRTRRNAFYQEGEYYTPDVQAALGAHLS
jgi:hypothetical protein